MIMKKTIALIFSGEGVEKRISERTAESLMSMINKDKYNVIKVAISDDGSWFICPGGCKITDGKWKDSKLTPTYPMRLLGKSGLWDGQSLIELDCAIPALHGNFGEDGVIAGALEAAHIPFIGQSSYAAALCADKSYTKPICEHLGIPTAKWLISANESLHSIKERAEKTIGYPMFIKPARLGSSFGAHPVVNPVQFDTAYTEAEKISDGRILIEEFISSSFELECAFLNAGEDRFSPSGIISTRGSFYDYRSKYKEAKYRPEVAKLRKDVREKIIEYSRALCDYIGIRHLSRLDYFVTNSGEIYFNEINTFPGMTSTSLYPLMTEEMGFKKGEFINLLIEKVVTE